MEVLKEQIISVDIETTGIQKEKNEILQIAIIDGNEKVLFNSYIKPQLRKRWTEAEQINGISPKMVETAPIFSDVDEQIFNILSNAKIIIGYNINDYDIPFIEYHLGKLIKTRTIDIMKIFSNEIIKDWSDYFQNYKFQSLSKCCKYYNIKNQKEHDSLGDAQATLRCFYKMLENKDINYAIFTDHESIIITDTTVASGSHIKRCNKITALLLCIFLGMYGVHKFYEGKIGMGILYILTFGLFGIGWLIDIFIIISKPNPYYV